MFEVEHRAQGDTGGRETGGHGSRRGTGSSCCSPPAKRIMDQFTDYADREAGLQKRYEAREGTVD
jgi:hypothetical protein